jgi:signal transduction histidine kinase
VYRVFSNKRFKPMDIALAMLLAGWVPSILMAIVSYTTLRDELEHRVVDERRASLRLISDLIDHDLSGSQGVLEYFQTLPLTQTVLLRPPGDPAVQAWLSDVYFSHPPFDGFFATDAEGQTLGSIPPVDGPGKISATQWLVQAQHTDGSYVTPAHRREDGRLVATVLAVVRSRSGEVIGYIGADILIERLGKRLAPMQVGEKSRLQVLDQRGAPLFNPDFTPNGELSSMDAELLALIKSTPDQIFRHRGKLYTFNHMASSGWTTLLGVPLDVAYQPVRQLLGKIAVLGLWLLAGTTLAAWLISSLYRNQLAADERIAVQTALNEKILANMPIAIATVQPQTQQVVQANDSFFALAERLAGALEDTDDFVLKLSHLGLGLEEMIAQISSGEKSLVAREQSATSIDGEPVFLTVTLLRIEKSPNSDAGVLCLIDDNTADVTTQQALIKANTAKDQFLALLSHELRNPLSPVITAVSQIEDHIDASPELHNALEVIRRNVELEARLIDDLLDINRITHHKLQLNIENIDAHEAIRRAMEICDTEIQGKGLRAVIDLGAERHHVQADPARLQQVFWNLIKNAVKFTSSGEIRVSSRNDGEELVVEIQDTGIGIEPERLDGVFKAFEQGGSAITRRFGGLGLGLAISKAMIEAHHGSITARSDGKDRGSTFEVRLATCDPAPVEPEKPAPAPATPATGRRRILVVDDHFDSCEGLRLLLARRGYDVEVAGDVAGAITAFDRAPVDLVISDLGLPDGTGFDLMREIRTRNPTIPGIALSGFGMETDVDQSHAAGFAEHLIKPVNIERLDKLLKQLLA